MRRGGHFSCAKRKLASARENAGDALAIANLVGMSYPQWTLETDEVHDPSLRVLETIAETCDVPITWLLGFDESSSDLRIGNRYSSRTLPRLVSWIFSSHPSLEDAA